jgi:hypothetical protein
MRALRPGLATIPGAMLLIASSPYAKRGELYNAFRKHFGKDDAKVLVWKAATLAMHPTLEQRIVDEAYESDPEAARAEYGAEFRDDLADFVTREAIDAVTAWGRSELPPEPGVVYSAFCDPSGGVRDAMTLAVAHLRAIARSRGWVDAILSGHGTVTRSVALLGWTGKMAYDLVCAPSVPPCDHPARCLALYSLHTQLSRRRRSARRARSGCLVRDGATMGLKIRAGVRSRASPSTPAVSQSCSGSGSLARLPPPSATWLLKQARESPVSPPPCGD